MFKPLVKLDCLINEKLFQLLCEPNSNIAEFKEALFQFLLVIGKIEDAAKAQAQQAAAAPVPEPQTEPVATEAVQPQAAPDAS